MAAPEFRWVDDGDGHQIREWQFQPHHLNDDAQKRLTAVAPHHSAKRERMICKVECLGKDIFQCGPVTWDDESDLYVQNAIRCHFRYPTGPLPILSFTCRGDIMVCSIIEPDAFLKRLEQYRLDEQEEEKIQLQAWTERYCSLLKEKKVKEEEAKEEQKKQENQERKRSF